MARPRLLMIDELSLGLAPVLVEGLMETSRQLNADGTTVLIVEQDVQAALERATRGYVLEAGHVVLRRHRRPACCRTSASARPTSACSNL